MPRKTTKTPPASRRLKTAEAEQYSGLTRRTLHRLASEGRLTKYYVGAYVRWDADELDALTHRRRVGGAPAGSEVGNRESQGEAAAGDYREWLREQLACAPPISEAKAKRLARELARGGSGAA